MREATNATGFLLMFIATLILLGLIIMTGVVVNLFVTQGITLLSMSAYVTLAALCGVLARKQGKTQLDRALRARQEPQNFNIHR